MIYLYLSGRRIIVRAEYRHKDAIKALGSWPDVKWDPDAKRWNVDARLFDKMAQALGADFAPLEDDFLRRLPVPEERVNSYYHSMKRNAELAEQERTKRYGRSRQRSAHDEDRSTERRTA